MNVKLLILDIIHFPLSLSSLPHYQAEFKYIEKGLLLIKILKCNNQLHSFRRLEQCSRKQINCETAVEFLKLCQNFELTRTFARVDKTKSEKWNSSSTTFEQNVVAEEHCQKTKRMAELKKETSEVY